jgi:hypothetical protein
MISSPTDPDRFSFRHALVLIAAIILTALFVLATAQCFGCAAMLEGVGREMAVAAVDRFVQKLPSFGKQITPPAGGPALPWETPVAMAGATVAVIAHRYWYHRKKV